MVGWGAGLKYCDQILRRNCVLAFWNVLYRMHIKIEREGEREFCSHLNSLRPYIKTWVAPNRSPGIAVVSLSQFYSSQLR